MAAAGAMGLRIGGRPLGRVLRALGGGRHYAALGRAASVYARPAEALRRYLLGSGHYPAAVTVMTPLGPVPVQLYSRADMMTLNEVFCRHDYPVPAGARSLLDWGANIGITALYALTRNPRLAAVLYEPLPMNAERLGHQLARFAGRWRLHRAAVGLADGSARFGHEPTGRYGGLNRDHLPGAIEVPVRAANAALAEALEQFGGSLDVLKIDVEGLEADLLRALDPALLARVKLVVAETAETVPLPGHSAERFGSVVRYRPA